MKINTEAIEANWMFINTLINTKILLQPILDI